MSKRDEFSPTVRRALAQRAGYRCCNPRCRAITVRPHSDESRAVITGVAAHICAAASGGPRYDENQSSAERSSLSNGVWICHSCSDLIDSDVDAHPTELLRQWRQVHEAWVSGQDLIPTFPNIVMETRRGLAMPRSGPFELSGDMALAYRDHDFFLDASSGHELHQLKLRIQFPESVIEVNELEGPAGVEFRAFPEIPDWTVNLGRGATISRASDHYPTNIYIFELEKLIPHRPVRLSIRTVQSVADQIPGIGAMRNIGHFSWIEGSFLYREQGQLFERTFISIISEVGERRYVASSPEDDDGTRQLLKLSFTG